MNKFDTMLTYAFIILGEQLKGTLLDEQEAPNNLTYPYYRKGYNDAIKEAIRLAKNLERGP